MTSDATLDAVLSTLLPGDGPWPDAGTLGLAGLVRADLGDQAAILGAALPERFATAGEEARVATLRALETARPELFERLIAVAYTAYYVDARVRATIERETGYENRPPQPLGYVLEPFDERLLDRQRRRAPFWRQA
jgi:hypothetical protein